MQRLWAWLHHRRRARLEREERELADLIERAYFCRCMSRFVDSVLTFRHYRSTNQDHGRVSGHFSCCFRGFCGRHVNGRDAAGSVCGAFSGLSLSSS